MNIMDSAKLRIVKPSAVITTPETWFSDMVVLVENCGRRSHKSERRAKGGSASDFIKRIAFDLGHESIIEHASITVNITGSRAMSHQLVRHRIAAYTQESQRYVDYSKDRHDNIMNVVVPPSIGDFSDGTLVFNTGLLESVSYESYDKTKWSEPQQQVCPWKISMATWCDITNTLSNLWHPIYSDIGDGYKQMIFFHTLLTAYRAYLTLREKDVPSEDARFVLPNSCKTEVATTYNIRQWRHVFKMRCTPHAQWEIREIMKSILRMFINKLPEFFGDMRDYVSEPINNTINGASNR